MPPRHRLLALGVVLMWGLNYTAIDLSLDQFPPMLLAGLRFGLVAVPTVLLVPRPQVPLRWLIGYGLGFGTVQFVFLHAGMAAGMPAGLASLVVQASAPLTVVLGATFLRERLRAGQLVGIALAAGGLTTVGWHHAGTSGLTPFLLVLAGAAGWAFGNVSARKAQPCNALHLALWMCAVPPLPLLTLSLVVEGPHRIATSMATLDDRAGIVALLALGYSAVIATVGGSGVWAWLLARHSTGAVAPFSMLVPIVGIGAAWLVLGQSVAPIELAGAALVVGGVFLASLRRGSSSTAPVRATAASTVIAEQPAPTLPG